MTIPAEEQVKCFVVWSLSFWFQKVIISRTFWFWCKRKGELSGSKSMDLDSCQWFNAYAEGLKKYWLRGCCCNARAFGVSSHYKDNLNNGKKAYYFREKGKKDTLLLTSRINRIICEFKGDGQEKNSLAVVMSHSCKRVRTLVLEEKLWETVKEIENPWDEGGNSPCFCCKRQLSLGFWNSNNTFLCLKLLSWQSLHLSEGKY